MCQQHSFLKKKNDKNRQSPVSIKVIIKIKTGFFFTKHYDIHQMCPCSHPKNHQTSYFAQKKKSLCRCDSVKDCEKWELGLNMRGVQYNHKRPYKMLTRMPKSRQRPHGNESRYGRDEALSQGLPPTTIRNWMIYARYFSVV